MGRLGPFEPRSSLAAAVSGGPDSMALALLARDWAAECGGSVLALIVDHGLRPESAAEALLARERLERGGVPARVLRLEELRPGPALAERARAARYAALTAACSRAGIVHLLLGHHAADQAETVLIRALSASGEHGLAGMAALAERPSIRLLRPLLDVPPALLRAILEAAGWEWVEDPSNLDPTATRARIRALRLDRDGTGPASRALVAAAEGDGRRRALSETALAEELAERVSFRPEGFAVITAGTLSAGALAQVVAAVAGPARPVAPARVAGLAVQLRAATVAGARLLPAGRLGPGWLVVREAAGVAPEIRLGTGVVWDGRFRVSVRVAGGDGEEELQPYMTVGALGCDSRMFRRLLPAAVLRTLPAIRADGKLAAVPHLGWPEPAGAARFTCLFAPAQPAGAAPFMQG